MSTISREKRYFQLQDWMGNVYEQAAGSSSVGSQSGGTIDGGLIGTDYLPGSSTDGLIQSDGQSSTGSSIVITPGSYDKNIATVKFSDLTFGRYAIMARIKSSDITSDKNIITISSYYTDGTNANGEMLLQKTLFKAKDLKLMTDPSPSTDQYYEIGTTVDFTGAYTNAIALRVEIKLLANTNTMIALDYISVQKEQGYYTGNDTSVGGRNAGATRRDEFLVLDKEVTRIGNRVIITLASNGWTNSGGIYSQRVNVPGMKATDKIDLAAYIPKSLAVATAKAQRKASGMVTDGESYDGYCIIYCGAGKLPTTNFQVMLSGVSI